MKRDRSPRLPKTVKRYPVEERRDWLLFSGFARMHVWNSGGPIHAPHEKVLQLFIQPWHGNYESWTVYRHETKPAKDGKVVFKKWNRETDLERFRSLGPKPAPKDWRKTPAVVEKQFTVPGRWVRELERKVGALSIPPIAGTVRPLPRDVEYKLSLWRSTQESHFSWYRRAPAAWKPLARLYFALLRTLRAHADGKPLIPITDLQFKTRR
jgi:hypothetical protein